MDQTVNIPFSIRLEPGHSTFKIEVDKKYTDNPNRLFGFSTVTLAPDFYNQQAFKLDLDSEEELKATISHDFQIEVAMEQHVYDSKKYAPPTATKTVAAIIKTINTHFVNNQPEGAKHPPIVIDWVDLSTLGMSPEDRGVHIRSYGNFIYGEPFGDKHIKALPQVWGDVDYLNHYAFPSNPTAYENTRIRINMAPGASITFSNMNMLKSFGFSENQIQDLKKPKFSNPHFTFLTAIANKPIVAGLDTFNTVVHAYPESTNARLSETFTLTTTKQRERKPELLAEDFSAVFQKAGESCNIKLFLEYDDTNHQFKIVFPSDPKIKVAIRVPPYIGHKLGYGHVTKITPDSEVSASIAEVQLKDVEKVSRVQAFDTGMVIISLDQIGSQQTYKFTNTFMALLESDFGGYMTTKMGIEWPRVAVSPFNSVLEFVISRYSETNAPIPLGWKTGAYVRGLLVGKV